MGMARVLFVFYNGTMENLNMGNVYATEKKKKRNLITHPWRGKKNKIEVLADIYD